MPDGPQRDAGVKAMVHARFSQTAAAYRASRVHAQGPEFDQLRTLAQFQGAEWVVDAGCGAGHTTAHVAPHVGHVLAVDLSEAMLDQARELCAARGIANVTFLRGDVEQLDAVVQSATDRPIDVVVSRYSAHHWPNPQPALAACHRLLRRRSGAGSPGRLFLMDVVSRDEFVYDTHLQAIELLRDPSHVRDHSVSQWRAMLTAAGFQARAGFEWRLAIDFADWTQRMQTPAPAVEAIRRLFAGAPQEVADLMALNRSTGDFEFHCALIEGVATE